MNLSTDTTLIARIAKELSLRSDRFKNLLVDPTNPKSNLLLAEMVDPLDPARSFPMSVEDAGQELRLRILGIQKLSPTCVSLLPKVAKHLHLDVGSDENGWAYLRFNVLQVEPLTDATLPDLLGAIEDRTRGLRLSLLAMASSELALPPELAKLTRDWLIAALETQAKSQDVLVPAPPSVL